MAGIKKRSKWDDPPTMMDKQLHLTEKLTRTVEVGADFKEGEPGARGAPWGNGEPITSSNLCDGLEDIQRWGRKNVKDFQEAHREWRRGGQPRTPRIPQRSPPPPLEIPDAVRAYLECLKSLKVRGGGPEVVCPSSMSEFMERAAADTIRDIRCCLLSEGASTYGLPYDNGINMVNLLGNEVWCERSKIALQLKLLRDLLDRTKEEADACMQDADRAYGGGISEELIKQFKMIQHCLKPIRDRRALVYRRGQSLARMIRDALTVLHHPIDVAVSALVNKRGGRSPVEDMWSNLTTDVIRGMSSVVGSTVDDKGCPIDHIAVNQFRLTFPRGRDRIGRVAVRSLKQATWASVALTEFFKMRGAQFPEFRNRYFTEEDGDEDDVGATSQQGQDEKAAVLYLEGPIPPARRPVPYERWATQRDAYYLFEEADHFRKLIRAHGHPKATADTAVPALPEKDRKLIWDKSGVTAKYLNEQVCLWRSRWVVKHTIDQRRLELKCDVAQAARS